MMHRKHVIVGTAGHIDHGKSTLVRSLTGIDPDRLAEEKRRGITIDIGFAHLELEEFQIAFIDVPGHERFIKNMLAGIGGVRLVVLVVAADESVMPQTVEHFQICRLLGIRHGLVVLTKADLADEEMLELVQEEVRDLLVDSPLSASPVVAVDSLSGRGLEDLRSTLLSQLRLAEDRSIQERASRRVFCMPVDRVFSVKGFGTVVTGTVVSGSAVLEQAVEIQPVGRTAKLRGIEVFGATAPEAAAGRRTALNLAGVDRAEVERGMVIGEMGGGRPTRAMDCRIELISTAPPLHHRNPIRFHHGSAEVVGRVYLMEGEVMAPGSSGFCRLRLQDPTVVYPGDRLILRRYSPQTTIAGGVILDNQPSRIRRRDLPAVLPELERLATALAKPGEPDAALVRYVVRAEGIRGADLARLSARTGLKRATLREIGREVEGLLWVSESPPHVVWSEALEARERAAVKLVREFHEARPLAQGISKEELKRRLLPDASGPIFNFLLERLQRNGTLESRGGTVALAGMAPRLGERQQAARDAILEWAEAQPFQAIPLEELSRKLNAAVAEVKEVYYFLLQQGELVRINEELALTPRQLTRIVDRLRASFPGGRPFSVPEFKDLFGISRKFAIPVLEHFDRERLTRRDGDSRIVV